MGFREIGEM